MSPVSADFCWDILQLLSLSLVFLCNLLLCLLSCSSWQRRLFSSIISGTNSSLCEREQITAALHNCPLFRLTFTPWKCPQRFPLPHAQTWQWGNGRSVRDGRFLLVFLFCFSSVDVLDAHRSNEIWNRGKRAGCGLWLRTVSSFTKTLFEVVNNQTSRSADPVEDFSTSPAGADGILRLLSFSRPAAPSETEFKQLFKQEH